MSDGALGLSRNVRAATIETPDHTVSTVMQSRRDVLGVGIVGCGYAAERLHLPALRAVRSVKVVAIADPEPERLRLVGSRFAIERRYRDHEALVQDAAVDAVAVCAPPHAHAMVASAVLDARKHVLVEKPLCLDLEDADRLVQHARRTPVTAMVGFNLRYHRHVQAARQAIRRGLIGPVELVRTVWSTRVEEQAGLPEWRRRRELGGGVLFELAVHHVDLWRFLLGTEVDRIFASGRTGRDDDHTATLNARLQNGAFAVSAFSQRSAEAHEIEIYGRHGRLAVSLYRFDGFELAPVSTFTGDLTSRVRAFVRAARAAPGMISAAIRGGTFLEAYRAEWACFADSALGGKPAPCTFVDGRQALEVVRAAVESMRSGHPSDLGTPRRTFEEDSSS